MSRKKMIMSKKTMSNSYISAWKEISISSSMNDDILVKSVSNNINENKYSMKKYSIMKMKWKIPKKIYEILWRKKWTMSCRKWRNEKYSVALNERKINNEIMINMKRKKWEEI